MNLGLHYKNQDHIFDEKEVNGVPFLSYPMWRCQQRMLGNDEYQYNQR